MSQSHLGALYADFRNGEISRREFMRRGMALGISASLLVSVVANTAVAQDATPAADTTKAFPDSGTEGQERGAGPELLALAVQAASQLSVHNATGGKDIGAGMVILEPLITYGEAGVLIPVLATEVPSIANGSIAEDLSTVTFTLKPDILWSDGTPFTAEDVKFTWEWNINPENGSIDRPSWDMVSNIEVIDDLTVKATFDPPTFGWFQPFGGNIGAIYPKHYWEGSDDPIQTNIDFGMNPIGTGPYKLANLSPNEEVLYEINEHFREPNKPFFKTLRLKGNSEPDTSVRAVTVTGEWDLGFDIMMAPETMESLVGDLGEVSIDLGTGVEKLMLNFSDPNTEVDGQKSHVGTPHPYFSDPAVREAVSMAIDRATITEKLYGSVPASNMLVGMTDYESPNIPFVYDPQAAIAKLEEAGWVLDGNVRSKDGVELKALYTTTVNQRRQRVQAVVKANLEAIGFSVELNSVDGSVFFDSDIDNTQNFTHFYSDIQMYQDGATSAYPVNYMKYWYAGPDNENISQRENNYSGTNKARYVNPEYDVEFEKLTTLVDPEDVANQFILLNDIVIRDVVEVPIAQSANFTVINHRMNKANIIGSPFVPIWWNLHNWNLAEDQ